MFVTCFHFLMLYCVLSFTTLFNCTPLCYFAIIVIFVIMTNRGYIFSYGWNYQTGIQLKIYQPSQLTWLILIYVQYIAKITNKYTCTLKCDRCQFTFHKNCTLLTNTELKTSCNLDPKTGLIKYVKISWIFWMNAIMYMYSIIPMLCIRKYLIPSN